MKAVYSAALNFFSAILVFISMSGCIPTPEPVDITLPLLTWYIAFESDCVYAGYDRNVAGGGVLVCVPNIGGACADTLFIQSETEKEEYTGFFNDQGLINSACTLPASYASERFSALNIPSNWILYHAGGTSGPHINGSYISRSVFSCSDLGLNDPVYHGAQRLASGYENSLLFSREGMLGLEDPGGGCTDLQLITDKEKSVVENYHLGNIAIYAACSFGQTGSSLPVCPESIDTSKYNLPGI